MNVKTESDVVWVVVQLGLNCMNSGFDTIAESNAELVGSEDSLHQAVGESMKGTKSGEPDKSFTNNNWPSPTIFFLDG